MKILALLVFAALPALAQSSKQDGVTVHWYVSKRLPDWLGIVQPPVELSKSTIMVCARSDNPGINSLEITAVYRIAGKERSASRFIKNAEKIGCEILASEPTLAGELKLVDVVVKEQPVTSERRIAVSPE